MQGTRVQSLVWEDSPSYGVTRPPVPQLLSQKPATGEAHAPGACALQQKPPDEKPAHHYLGKPSQSIEDPAQTEISKLKQKG